MPPTTKLLAAVAVASLLVACGDDGDGDDAADTTTTATTEPGASADGIAVEGSVGESATISIPAGFEASARLVIEDVVEGDGEEVPPGATVTVHYLGVFLDGSEFDSSFSRGQPATFGLDQVIAGWTEGIPGMRIGGRRLLVIPPDLAYGEQGRPGIPPDSPLVFVVDLLDIA